MQPTRIQRATVLGGGAFGTALAFVLARQGCAVRLWLMDKKESNTINAKRENVHYLPGFPLNHHMSYTSSVDEALIQHRPELVILVIPTQFVSKFVVTHKDKFPPNVPIIVGCKGIEIASLQTPYDMVLKALPQPLHNNVCVLSGPSFAKELAEGKFTAVAIAAKDIKLARKVQRMVSAENGDFRAYATTDVIGTEMASAVKNVLAVGAGIADGLGMGVNARAALICRGLMEVTALAKAMGSDGSALPGLAGIGDLLLTCSSPLSRNFTVGRRLGKGESIDDIMKTTKAVAEGVPTAKALEVLSQRLRVHMPICHQVYKILYTGRSVNDSFVKLVHMPLIDEHLVVPSKL